MKKNIILIFLLVLSMLWGSNSYFKVRDYEKSINYYYENLFEVLTTFDIDSIADITRAIEYSTKLRLVTQLNTTRNLDINRTYILHTLDQFNVYFSNDLNNNFDPNNLDKSKEYLNILQKILIWLTNEDNPEINDTIFIEYLVTLDLDEEMIEQIVY